MANRYKGNLLQPGRNHNYSLGSNITNSFAIGEVGSNDDFFLVGIEPHEESNYPLLTGNLLDSNGNLLFQIRDNVLTINPANCTKVFSEGIGYEIHDLEGVPILKVETKMGEIERLDTETYVTTISANFYNRNGELVLESNEENQTLHGVAKTIFGFSGGGFAASFGFTQDEANYLRHVFMSKAFLEPVRGELIGQKVQLGGKVFFNVAMRNCEIVVDNGNFLFTTEPVIDNCSINFIDEAANVLNLYEYMQKFIVPNQPGGQNV